jgi:uncharacterized protein YprB with RNaseH-like and TPR domain
MIPDEIRRKLEALNRGPMKVGEAAGKTPRREPASAKLEEVVRGKVVGGPDRPCFLVERDLSEIFDRADELTREFRSVWTHGKHALSDEDLARAWAGVIGRDPKRLIFLDIETLGLTATPVFLIGTMHLDDDGVFRLRQYFARDYAEEPNVISQFARLVNDGDTLVTFNGKSFDWPYLCDRAVYHAARIASKPAHVDLLHESRRRWKTVLPNCQLQTLEYHVSRRRRVGDLPGSLIPDAYHRYVKTAHARQMVDVIHHNALDLLTMAELMLFILQGGDLAWD